MHVTFSLKPLSIAISLLFGISNFCQAQSETAPPNQELNRQEINKKEQESEKGEKEKASALESKKRGQQRNPAAPTQNPSKSDQVQKVTVNGAKQTETDVRRNSIAGKIVIGREELDRDGDSTVGEILKRLPGVTTGGRPGRGGDVRMRGMGGGYTQILINGERPPRGFSMESLAPDQIERIEIMRGPVAEFSTQAIAGTINIVLREEFHPKDTDLKLALGMEQGRIAPNLSITYPGQVDSLNYALSGSISQNGQKDQSITHKEEVADSGQVNLVQDQIDHTRRTSTAIHLTPRLSYRFENGDSLNLQPLIMNNRNHSNSDTSIDQTPQVIDPITQKAPVARAYSSGNAESTFGRANLNYQHKFEDTSKLTVKLGLGLGRSESNNLRKQFASDGSQLNLMTDVNNTRDTSWSLGGKYTTPLGEKQNLAAGWEIENSHRNQTRISLDNGLPQFVDSGDNLDANTRRVAAYAQDEIDINAQWSAYAGLRWEGIDTHSTKSNYVVNNTSRVVNPIVHAVYRIPGWGKDQIRMGLTSSYRAPSLNDIIAVPTISPLNGPTRPDRSGNPDLKPESSRGLDIAFEHYLKGAGIMSVNLFARSINDLIRRRTELVDNGNGARWVNSPINIGHALAKGIELEAKFPLQEFFADGPAVDVRSNFSRFWSSVDDVKGPNNRLDQQPTMTANLGMDYRPSAQPWSAGGNFNWTPGYTNQVSDTQTSISGVKKQIDVYALWKFSANAKLRLSASNLQANDFTNGSSLYVNGVNYLQSSRSKTYTVFNLRLELKI